MDRRGFLLSSVITYLGTAVGIVLMASFYIISLRMGAEAFGELQASMAVLFLLYTGRGIAGSYIVIHSGGDERSLPGMVRGAMRLSVLMGLATAGAFIFFAPFIRDFLHMPSAVPFVLIGISALPGMLAGTMDGILNVQRKFGALAISSFLIPLGNVLMALLLLRDGLQEYDAGWIVLGSQLFSCLNLFFVDWSFLRTRTKRSDEPRTSLKEVAILLLASLLFGGALHVDVFWARHVLPVEIVGMYAICASVANVLYQLSASIARISSVSLRGGGSARIVGLSYALIGCVSVVLALGFAFIGQPFLNAVVGHTVPIDWNVLLPLFIAMPCFAVITFDFTCLNVMTKSVHVGIGIALVLAQVVALATFGISASTIAWSQASVMGSLMVVFSFLLLRAVLANVSSPAAHPAEQHLTPTA